MVFAFARCRNVLPLASFLIPRTFRHNATTPLAWQWQYTADTNFIFDFALVFTTPNNGPPIRIDVTIIPKVYRHATYSKRSAFLCRPDAQDTQFKISTAVHDYIPRLGNCAAAGRPKPYAAINSDYATAHPEEYAWLQGRLDQTAPKVHDFVQNKAGLTLSPTQSRLKIAVVHSGGGKRAMLHSLGTYGR